MKQEKRRVNDHLNGEKLPFLFHYQMYTSVAKLLRSNVKTVCSWGTTKGVLKVTEYSKVTRDYTHWRGVNSRALSPIGSPFSLHGEGAGTGPGVVKQGHFPPDDGQPCLFPIYCALYVLFLPIPHTLK